MLRRNIGQGHSVISKTTRTQSLAIYLPDLSGGGAERLHLSLAPLFLQAGLDVTLLLDQRKGALAAQVPEGIRVVELGAERQIKAVFKLARYLRNNRPDVLISNMEHMNVMAVLARAMAHVPTRVFVTQHNAFSEQVKKPSIKFRVLPRLYRLVLPFADKIVAVSSGVADDLSKYSGLNRDRMTVIYNGVVSGDFEERATVTAPTNRWHDLGLPIITGMGRFVQQKDFPSLLQAFAKVISQLDARLLILGDGPMRKELEEMATTLGIAEKVAMPGFIDNPLPEIKNTSVFVLTSRFEGFGNVIAEALACGTPVVSTNCPHGPAEILMNGQYGKLVPVGDVDALAEAIITKIKTSEDRDLLKRRGNVFSTANCAKKYLDLMQ